MVLADQERRLNELVESGKSLATDVAERVRQMQGLNEELNRSGAVKDELLNELARVQVRQREAVAQIEASGDQLRRVESLMAQLEQRRTQLTFTERKISAFEAKIGELKQLTDDVDTQIAAITGRQALVAAVKAEVESVHEVGARSKADLQYVAEHRSDVAALRNSVDGLLALMGQTDEKLALIEGRKKLVDEVEAKSTMIVNLLEDVRVNLEALGEQKALVDHVAEKLARADFVLQEAQNTLRSLHQERELAARIEQSIKQLRTRTERTPEEVQEGKSKKTA
jgi:chromosome segregation ATPase